MNRLGADDPSAPSAHTDERHRPKNWALGAGIGFFILMALFWTAIFSGSFTHRNPDELYDKGWVAEAAKICAPAARTIKNLPNASTAKSPADRAELVDRGTAALEPMLASLNKLARPERASDRTVVHGFLADWRIYLGDRRAFSKALLRDPAAKPLISEVHGGWVTDAIDTMANINNIPDCATPQDM